MDRAAAVLALLDEGASLVLTVDSEPPEEGEATTILDRELATIAAETSDRTRAGGRRAILLVLVPRGGRPALIAAGAALRKGRVVGRSMDAADIAAAVTLLLGLPQRPGDESAEWFRQTCLQRDPKSRGGRS